MIGKIIGALVGREIDRRDGRGGAKGAVAGYISAALLRRAAAIGLLLGAAYYARKTLDRRRAHLYPHG